MNFEEKMTHIDELFSIKTAIFQEKIRIAFFNFNGTLMYHDSLSNTISYLITEALDIYIYIL